MLRPDGVLIFSDAVLLSHTRFPDDYWRFTPAAYETLLEDYPSKIIGWHGARNRPANVWAVAFAAQRPAVTPAGFACYRMLLAQYAKEPETSWTRRIWLSSRPAFCAAGGPFASYLDRNVWDSVCLNAAKEQAAAA